MTDYEIEAVKHSRRIFEYGEGNEIATAILAHAVAMERVADALTALPRRLEGVAEISSGLSGGHNPYDGLECALTSISDAISSMEEKA